jgi:hypothetical protein
VSGTIAPPAASSTSWPRSVDPKIGNRDLERPRHGADLGVQLALDAWHSRRQFNYTFDSDTSASRRRWRRSPTPPSARPYRQNGKIRLALDRPQATSTALFTHRNKKPKSETITRKFASDADYDGVELLYQDPETESRRRSACRWMAATPS